jgi:putative heme-binding domain-containing protein
MTPTTRLAALLPICLLALQPARARAAETDAGPAAELRPLPGFRAEVVYRVPRAQGSWVCLTCDPKGRLITSDQYGKLYRVTLHAAGGAARVEPLKVALGRAQGLLCAFGSLYAVVSHDDRSGLFRARETAGGDYGEPQLLRRFRGDGEHGPHAVVLGSDGKSLYVVGGNGSPIPKPERSLLPRNWGPDELLPPVGETDGRYTRDMPGGWVCRTDPDGKAFELVAAGFRNPYDLAFDRDGELFTYDSDMEWDMGTPWYRPTRVCHVTSGAEFGWRTGSAKWPDHYPDGLPPAVDVGAGSPTGLVFGYGAKFPARYQQALFMGDWSYGRIFAVHLTPKGSTSSASVETFLSGTPLPVTDLVVHPADGGLYFIVGGRGAASALYRVTYTGAEPTTAVKPTSDTASARARARRRALEAFHGRVDGKCLEVAWPALADPDHFIRYAARIAVEHQPVETWRERALAEKDPRTLLAALVALARCGDRALLPRVGEALGRVDWEGLAEDDRLDLLRAYTLAFTRMGPPDETVRAAALARLDKHYPTPSERLSRELCPLLIYLEAPGVVGRTLGLLAKAPTQEEQLHYVACLRAAGGKLWTLPQREEYFRWFRKAAALRGGVSLEDYFRLIRKEAAARLSAAEKKALGGLLAEPPRADPYAALKSRPLVKEWKVDDLLPHAGAKMTGRDFERGRRVFSAALCSGCHRFNGLGGMTGPDLTGVASRYDTRTLLESILEPSKVIPDQYAAVVIEDVRGRVHTGKVKDLFGEELVVMTDALDPATLVKVRRSEVVKIQRSAVSMMPDGLLNGFTREEALDLIAYLRSRGDPGHEVFRKAAATR